MNECTTKQEQQFPRKIIVWVRPGKAMFHEKALVIPAMHGMAWTEAIVPEFHYISSELPNFTNLYSPALPPKQLFRFLRPPHIFRILSCPCAHGMEYYARWCGVISAWRAPASTHFGLIHLSRTKEWLDGFLASGVLLLTD